MLGAADVVGGTGRGVVDPVTVLEFPHPARRSAPKASARTPPVTVRRLGIVPRIWSRPPGSRWPRVGRGAGWGTGAGAAHRRRCGPGLLRTYRSIVLPIALGNFANGALLQNYGSSMAGALLASAPTLVPRIVLGRYFIGGLRSGSVKG